MKFWGALSLAALIIIACLSACDPGVTLHLARRDGAPMVCPDDTGMTFSFTIQYKDGEQFVDSFDVDKEIQHPTVGMLEGSMERLISWVQFKLYCGESKPPVLVTAHIVLPDDLVKKDEHNYYYYVDRLEP